MRNINFNTQSENHTPCYIIAEIGVNHGGNVELAKKLVDAAKEAGADAVKFQTFTAESLVTKDTPKVPYQQKTTCPSESHYEMIRGLEFSRDGHRLVKDYCDTIQIDFISTPYDIAGAAFLDKLGVLLFKTASADLVDTPLQKFLAQTGKPVIIATGMATLGEVEATVNIYRQYAKSRVPNIALLHCVSNYPCSNSSLNLRAMQTLKSAFHTTVGYSDHSVGSLAAIVAVSLGAKIIEKHFTLDKSMPGPDHKASCTPQEFSELVKTIRNTEEALGTPVKKCQSEEKQMARVSRKSIVLARDVVKGKILEHDDIVMKRPGTGMPASAINMVIGKTALHNLYKDNMLSICDVG